MEALTAVSTACLTLYGMLEAVRKDMGALSPGLALLKPRHAMMSG